MLLGDWHQPFESHWERLLRLQRGILHPIALRRAEESPAIVDWFELFLLPSLHGFAIVLNKSFPREGFEIGFEGLG